MRIWPTSTWVFLCRQSNPRLAGVHTLGWIECNRHMLVARRRHHNGPDHWIFAVFW